MHICYSCVVSHNQEPECFIDGSSSLSIQLTSSVGGSFHCRFDDWLIDSRARLATPDRKFEQGGRSQRAAKCTINQSASTSRPLVTSHSAAPIVILYENLLCRPSGWLTGSTAPSRPWKGFPLKLLIQSSTKLFDFINMKYQNIYQVY